jgi:flavin-binding protein dodecin
MKEETELRSKLQKIEALFSGTSHNGEKLAAAEAIKRIKEKIKALNKIEPIVETRCTLNDRWSRQLFTALCRRYGLEPYRYARQRYSTLMIKAPASFIDKVLWPEYLALDDALSTYLKEVTEKIIKEEIYKDIDEPMELKVLAST